MFVGCTRAQQFHTHSVPLVFVILCKWFGLSISYIFRVTRHHFDESVSCWSLGYRSCCICIRHLLFQGLIIFWWWWWWSLVFGLPHTMTLYPTYTLCMSEINSICQTHWNNKTRTMRGWYSWITIQLGHFQNLCLTIEMLFKIKQVWNMAPFFLFFFCFSTSTSSFSPIQV